MSKTFDHLYSRLNPEQKEAVDSVEGPVMVVAGPGTGKTEILTLRIANILRKTDTEPENILALTFTDSAASSMRRRLAEIIGSRAYAVRISTFHSFCNDAIRDYPEEFPHIIGSKHISEIDQIKIIERLIQDLPLETLKPFGDVLYYTQAVLSGINRLKQEGVTPGKFLELVEQEQKVFKNLPDLYHQKGAHKGKMKGEHQKHIKKIHKNRELALIYDAYQKTLRDEKLYDYTDMIMAVLERLSPTPQPPSPGGREARGEEDLLLILQEQHQYILVDEHQDTNNAQNKILELLGNFHPNPNIFVVGDEKQAIFRFQGASLENFLYFKNLYPEAKLITLTQNYRSSQNILDCAESLLRGEKPLRSTKARSDPAKVGSDPALAKLCSFSNLENETNFIARDVIEKIKSGISPEEIAILYRDNKDAAPIARRLEKEGIPFVVLSDQDLFSDLDIKKLLIIKRAIHNFGKDEFLVPLLHIDFFKIEPLDVYKAVSYARGKRISIFDVLKSKKTLASAGVSDKGKINQLYRKLSGWVTLSKNKGLSDFFETLVRDSGYLSYVLGKKNAPERLDTLNSFFDEIKKITEAHPGATLDDLIVYLDTVQEHGVLVRKKREGELTGRVRLMTVHRSKGLEFEYVYVANAFDGHFGNKRRPNLLPLLPNVYSLTETPIEEGSDIDDERRLFYVALTRAKRGVTISYAKESETGREQLESQFIREIKPELIQEIDTNHIEGEAHPFHPVRDRLSRREKKTYRPYDKDFICRRFEENGLSVSALNNYLECPWKYFYMNLLRVPKAPEKYQMYGSAIHGALRDFFEALKEREIGKKFLLDAYTRNLSRQPLGEEDYREVLEKGRKTLSSYFDFYKPRLETTILTEFKINGVLIAPEIRLTGVLDKIEFLDGVRACPHTKGGIHEASAGSTMSTSGVRVVDYKTGKSKTRNFILGKTKNSTGDYWRQLVFYKLLLDKHNPGRYQMAEGLIDFVEPDEKGRFRQEKFEITDGEVKELEKEIKRVSDEILNLKFWDRRCDQKGCEFCQLREIMK